MPGTPTTQLSGLHDVKLQGALLEPEDHGVHILPVCGQGALVCQLSFVLQLPFQFTAMFLVSLYKFLRFSSLVTQGLLLV